jgi:hypothetical protein
MSGMTDDFEKDFFPDASVVHIEMDILNDMHKALEEEFGINGWSWDDGLRFTLAAGLKALKFERNRSGDDLPVDAPEGEINRLQAERLQLEGRYAVMKYRAYQYMQAAKLLDMKYSAVQQQLQALEQANHTLQERIKDGT